MAIPIARVHLKVAHAALPALLPTPPKCMMLLPLLPTPCVTAVLLPKPLTKSGRADSDERWDTHKVTSADSVKSWAGRGSSRKSLTSPPRPGRADSAERWDVHKKAAIPAPSSSTSGTSSVLSSNCSISRVVSSSERWDVHKKRCPPQAVLLDNGESSSSGSGSNDIDPPQAALLDNGESSSSGSGSNDIDTEEEEEILWKPRAMYAGPGFAAAAPGRSMIPMPTAFLVPVA